MANLNAWKSFLKGRIAIESGDVAGGLALIDEAVKLDPSEPTFTRGRAVAATLPGATDLTAEYDRIAKANSGANDRPDVWLRDLATLLSQADGVAATSAVVW